MKKTGTVKRLTVLAVTLVLAVISMVSPFTNSYAVYNDEKYDSYVNMNQSTDTSHSKYVIPNLFRQDTAYTNIKLFPLVVNDSVEYFPLDIFALYSYLEVVYSKLAYGFYINNTRNGHYVAFDLETGITTTHNNQNVDIQAKIFHRTHYVPAKAVCEILGMTFESYDDETNKIRAARISDSKAKYTLEELVLAYSPIKKDPVQEDTPPKVDPKPDNPPAPVVQDDPYKKYGVRNIYLTFENCPDARNTELILDVLGRHGKTAIFFVEKEKILMYPDTVRRIVASGHQIGLYFSPLSEDGEVLSAEQLSQLLCDANNALHLVAKIKTRNIRAAYGYTQQLKENGFVELMQNNGYTVYDWNINSEDYNGYRDGSLEKLKKDLAGTNVKAARNVFIRFGTYSETPAILDSFLGFCNQYTQFRVMSSDEYTNAPSFIS